MSVTTKNGDQGYTRIVTNDGVQIVRKDDFYVRALNALDELNVKLGWIQYEPAMSVVFEISATVPYESECEVARRVADHLEHDLKIFEEELPQLKNFIYPMSDNEDFMRVQDARIAARKAEMVLAERAESYPDQIMFLNRLSDYLFVFARYVLQTTGYDEYVWNARQNA